MFVPEPRLAGSELVVEAPGAGPGWWAGGPSAAYDGETWWLAYRVRRPVDAGRGVANVVAASADGIRFEPVCTLEREAFDTESLERPALVRRPDGGWRLYVSCSTPGTKHWRVEAIDADSPAELVADRRVVSMPGDGRTAVKDPVVRAPLGSGRWQAWVCCHPLDVDGEEDRMVTRAASSPDGLVWDLGPVVLAGRPGSWDERGARVTTVGPGARWALYDGRASAEENWEERAGVALADGEGGGLTATGAALASPHGSGSLRYVDAVPLPDGAYRLFYEASRPDGAHELRTELVTPPTGPLAGR